MSLRELLAIALCAIGMLGRCRAHRRCFLIPPGAGAANMWTTITERSSPIPIAGWKTPETALPTGSSRKTRLTFGFLERLRNATTLQRLTELWNYRACLPSRKAGDTFSPATTVCRIRRALRRGYPRAEPRVLLDPNTLSTDGTTALVLATERGWQAARLWLAEPVRIGPWSVRDVRLARTATTIWTGASSPASRGPGRSGFYYRRYASRNSEEMRAMTTNKLFFHLLGEPQSGPTDLRGPMKKSGYSTPRFARTVVT